MSGDGGDRTPDDERREAGAALFGPLTYDEVLVGLTAEYRTTAQVAVALNFAGDLAQLRRLLDELSATARVQKIQDRKGKGVVPKYKLSAWHGR